MSFQKQRHRICSRIRCEVDERWCKAAVRPSPRATARVFATAAPSAQPEAKLWQPETSAAAERSTAKTLMELPRVRE